MFIARLPLALCALAALAACDPTLATNPDGTPRGNPVRFPEPQPLVTTDGSDLPVRPGVGVVTASASAMLPVAETLGGRTMTGTDQTFIFRRDGSYTRATSNGGQFQGVWEIRGDQFCWADTGPEGQAGETTCKQISLVLDQVTLFGGGTDLKTYTLG